jgi:FkbM family methyltransferase
VRKCSLSYNLGVKHFIKSLIKQVLALLGITAIFPGEHTAQGLRPLLIEFYQRQAKGIFHIGANTGAEATEYDRLKLPVIWVEADPNIFNILQERIKRYPKQIALNFLLSNKEARVEFFIANNSGQSSSVLPLSSIARSTWEVDSFESIFLNSYKLDNLRIDNLELFDFWVLDVQGHEMEVLIGAERSLNFAHWILIEISTVQYYEGQTLFHEVDLWLREHHFVPLYRPSGTHCEILYARRMENYLDDSSL